MSLITEHVETTGIQAQQTKEEFMTACLADGTSREVCDARWTAAHEVSPEVPPPTESPAATGTPTMGDLTNENEMLRARLKVREGQLKQAIGIANRANDENKAKTNAEKEMLVTSIQMDSDFEKDDLAKKHLNELRTIRLTLDKSMNKTFASVAADMAAADRKRKPLLTVGYCAGKDSNGKTIWKGGI